MEGAEEAWGDCCTSEIGSEELWGLPVEVMDELRWRRKLLAESPECGLRSIVGTEGS